MGQKLFFISLKIPKSFWKKHELVSSYRSTANSCPFPLSLGPRRKPFPSRKVLLKMRNLKRLLWTTSSTTPTPAWTKKPADLKEENYKSFYRELYPMQFEEPLFNIHLNVDYPFKLTGILYFPRLNNDLNIQKDRIQLYQNQVFVTGQCRRNCS